MFGQTAVVAPFQYVGAIYALISGWFIFNERLSMWNLVGISVILIGVLLGTIMRNYKKTT
jgi:drug/metabolite transporter (DMT)-like permease